MVSISQNNCALLIIDIINDFEFEGGEELFLQTQRIVNNIAKLKQRVQSLYIPVVYVNDNFKNWQTDFTELINICIEGGKRGKTITLQLMPDRSDYHILKPSYSGFYATPLHLLLEHLKVKTLILTGIAGNMCVQFTANDAFMYNYNLIVPSDCIASKTEEANQVALTQIREILKADITPSYELQFI